MTALETTARLARQIEQTFTARGAVYGPPEENFANIAMLWRAWLRARHGADLPLDAMDVGQMSALIKIARLAESPDHEDSALDAAVYTLLGHGCAALPKTAEEEWHVHTGLSLPECEMDVIVYVKTRNGDQYPPMPVKYWGEKPNNWWLWEGNPDTNILAWRRA